NEVVSAAAFDLGVQSAFAVALAAMIPAIALVLRFTKLSILETFVPSILAAHTAWHWMADRWARLSLFRPQWPQIDTAFAVAALRWLAILVVLFGGARFVFGILRSKNERA